MQLERLEILGFKSFAKKTTLIFPSGITCIVGPNGCGKSNIADCIRWILGEQSLKNLRADKNEDLIFSAGKKRLNLSQASLFLKNNEKEEIKITRKYFRNGESEYLINEKKTTREDLLFYLAKVNFGQKSYSIIGQGMVDRILYSSKQERKEFFDEATGIKEYQLKKSRAVAKIKRGLKNLHQAEIAIKEVEPRMRFLSRQIKKWEKRQEVEGKLIDLEKKYYGARLFKIRIEKTEIEKRLQGKKALLEKKEKELKIFQEELSNLASYEPDEEFKKLQFKWQELLDKRNQLLEERVKKQTAKYQQKPALKIETSDLSQLEKPIKELVKKQENFLKKLDQVQKIEDLVEIKQIAQQIYQNIQGLLKFFVKTEPSEQREEASQPKENKQLEIFNQDIKVLEEKLSKFLETENQKRKEMLALQEKLQEKQDKISSLNYQLHELEMERVKLEVREEDLKNEIRKEEILKNIETLPEIKMSWQEEEKVFIEIQKLKREMEQIGSFDENFLQEYKECKEKYDFLSSQIDDLQKSIASLEDIRKKLDEQIKTEFFANFNKINKIFKEYFKFLFKGGSAGLILEKEKKKREKENSNEPMENEKTEIEEEIEEEIKYGVEIYARPPNKKNKNVQSLSGGEKALTSIALIGAILKTKNPPFIMLDEVDAALDEANTIRVAEILKELSRSIQIIVITHNPVTMEVASALYGVTIDKESSSHLVSMKLENF